MELILAKCHMFCSIVCGVSGPSAVVLINTPGYVGNQVWREWIENQSSGCYSGSDDAELNSLMMKTVKSQAFLGSKD